MKSYKATLVSSGIAILCGFIHVYSYYLSHDSQIFFAIFHDGYALFTCIVTSLIVLFYGLYIDIKRNSSLESPPHVKEMHTSLISAMHHILNNFFNGMELIRMEAKGCEDFDPKIIRLYDESVVEAVDKIKRLSELEEISDEAVWDKLMPGMGSPLKK